MLLVLALPAAAWAQGAPPGLPRLTGIVTAPSGRAAIFESAGGQQSAVQEGEQVGIWTVRLIRPDAVQLDGDGRSLTVAPSPRGTAMQERPADTGGVTFGLVVNPPAPAPD